eukprot:XP_001697854.1 predicted protein [Chlamydomonas reinhardtii]
MLPQKKGGGAALQDVPLVGRGDEEIEVSDLELSDEDLEFVQKHSRRLGFLKSLDQSELDKWAAGCDESVWARVGTCGHVWIRSVPMTKMPLALAASRDGNTLVSRLAMLSLLAVYKDILPGYRIRPPTDKEQEVKTYLRSLLEGAQCVAKRTGTLSHSRVALDIATSF